MATALDAVHVKVVPLSRMLPSGSVRVDMTTPLLYVPDIFNNMEEGSNANMEPFMVVADHVM